MALRSHDGVRFQLAWIEEKKATLTVTNSKGDVQISTLVDFDKSQELQHDSSKNYPQRECMRDAPFDVQLSNDVGVPPFASSWPMSGSEGQVFVTVRQCGILDSSGTQSPRILVRDVSNDELVGDYPTTYVGNGVYRGSIPTGQKRLPHNLESCKRIESILGAVCHPIEALGPGAVVSICHALAVAIDVATIPSGEAAALMAACQSSIPTIALYCETIGQGPPGKSIAERLCEEIFENMPVPSRLKIQAWAAGLPKNIYGPAIQTPSTGPFPISLNMDLGGKSVIRTLELSPPNPSARQGYVASADIFCIPGGSVVRMSIVGTDKYARTIERPIQDTQVNGTFKLPVPGALQGVRDSVTTTLILPDKSTITKQAFLVFGG